MTPDWPMFQAYLQRDGVQLSKAQQQLCMALFAAAADDRLVAALLTQPAQGATFVLSALDAFLSSVKEFNRTHGMAPNQDGQITNDALIGSAYQISV